MNIGLLTFTWIIVVISGIILAVACHMIWERNNLTPLQIQLRTLAVALGRDDPHPSPDRDVLLISMVVFIISFCLLIQHYFG